MRLTDSLCFALGAFLLMNALGSSAHAQVRLSTPRAESVPDVYVVKGGDTLWDIASQFFGDPYEWPRIWSYNPAITNPHWIYPQDRLRLRKDARDSEEIASANNAAATIAIGSGVRIVQRESSFKPGAIRLRQLAYLDEDALNEAAVISGSPNEWMMMGPYDTVYMNFKGDERPIEGEVLQVFHEIDKEHRVVGEKGVLIRVLGTVRYEGTDPETGVGRGTIVEAYEPIERGYRLSLGTTSFEIVEPRLANEELEAKIVSSLMGRSVIGAEQLVFIDKGSEDGVEKGHEFLIIYAGDRYREQIGVRRDLGDAVPRAPQPSEYPKEVAAEAIVVDVREQTATLAIMHSHFDIRIGDMARARLSR